MISTPLKLIPNYPLGPLTWFRTGGTAAQLGKVSTFEDLQAFLRTPYPEPLTFLGRGTNILVRDGLLPGTTLILGKGFSKIKIDPPYIHAGAAALARTTAQTCAASGLGGLEFLYGIPGTLGGCVRMNAGAFQHDIKSAIYSLQALDSKGCHHTLQPDDTTFTYRSSPGIPKDWIITHVTLRGQPESSQAIYERIKWMESQRIQAQPIAERTGGSTFKNPPGKSAWQLIDEAGCRGLVRGGAKISKKHCNFIINKAQATASDIEFLAEIVRRKVYITSGFILSWEIERLGCFS